MATRKSARKPVTALQAALRDALNREWSNPVVSGHSFFPRWAVRAEITNLTPASILAHCLDNSSPNAALVDIADTVAAARDVFKLLGK